MTGDGQSLPTTGESGGCASAVMARFITYTLAGVCLLGATIGAHAAPPALTLDLANLSPATDNMLRVHGYTGSGLAGLPVAGPADIDGDGNNDTAFSSFQADPLGRTDAGEIYIAFGNGAFGDTLDTANASDSRLLRILGEGTRENAGSEIWIDDVTEHMSMISLKAI